MLPFSNAHIKNVNKWMNIYSVIYIGDRRLRVGVLQFKWSQFFVECFQVDTVRFEIA